MALLVGFHAWKASISVIAVKTYFWPSLPWHKLQFIRFKHVFRRFTKGFFVALLGRGGRCWIRNGWLIAEQPPANNKPLATQGLSRWRCAICCEQQRWAIANQLLSIPYIRHKPQRSTPFPTAVLAYHCYQQFCKPWGAYSTKSWRVIRQD
jgi:hypothetical protein